MTLTDIRHRINAGDDPDELRAALGEIVHNCLITRGPALGPLERVHIGLAIDLLPSQWLWLTWTHVDAVCNRLVGERQASRDAAPGSAPAPDVATLLSRLEVVRAEIEERRARDVPPRP